MGLFDKEKRKKEPLQEERRPDLSQRADYVTRPGGIFVVQLLMREKCETPSNERFLEVLSKYLGDVEQFGSREVFASFAAKNYISRFKDGAAPVQLMISSCSEFAAETIDAFQRKQMWECREERDSILSGCKFSVLANDTLGGGLPARVRADMLMDYLETLLELYPSCEAVYIGNSGKLVKADPIRQRLVQGAERYVQYAVKARFFR